MLMMILGPTSLVQKIHHSLDLQRLYKECQSQCSGFGATSTVYQNLRAAKHRFETFAAPLSRLILGLEGMILFACKLAVLRRGESDEGLCLAFCLLLTPETLILLAMLADASLEALSFVRGLDTESNGIVEISQLVEDFWNRIQWLYGEHEGSGFEIYFR